ncbi:MAG: right-handed parallel beta-helix repeat-containing protein, partial [Ignavibacteriaceae bacterium]|nr:right-handed parallel beta-helix repeat-containing protein [Ignavibacteriaceae bacterium]
MKPKLQQIILFTLTFFLFTCAAFPTTRFVSKTGSSVPPYTTWATASDSIQKCINICNDGDTVVVANGVYKEYLLISKEIALLGASMDSTIIDGTGLGDYYTIRANADVTISGFTIIGKGFNTSPYYDGVVTIFNNINVFNCKITHCNVALWVGQSSGILDGLIINDVYGGITTSCASDTCKPIIRNCVIILEGENADNGILNFYYGQPTILNNIIIGNKSVGINNVYAKRMIIENNLIATGYVGIRASTVSDTTFIQNNIIREQIDADFGAGISYPNRRAIIKNNILTNCKKGVEISTYENPSADFNLYWENEIHSNNGSIFGVHDIFADPMFVKDTVAKSLSYDYHLQKYSPAIDVGDPSILDVDGTRSDIGMYGGPLGSTYTYLNLPPKPPVNFHSSFDSSKIIINWDKFSEADFSHYNIYRSVVNNFIPDSSSHYCQTDTSYFIDEIPIVKDKIFYKITSVDSAGNESLPGEQIVITITGTGEPMIEVVGEYKLYQNYPNPFNPAT